MHCNAQEVIEKAQARWVDRYSEKSVLLEAETDAFDTSMSEEEIDCIIDNLLSNALHYSPRGSKVLLKLTQQGAMAIQDQGPGIPAEVREKVFERFERGKAIGRGHGIGLYLVKRLVEDSGGKVAIGESEIGANIIVSLPKFAA